MRQERDADDDRHSGSEVGVAIKGSNAEHAGMKQRVWHTTFDDWRNACQHESHENKSFRETTVKPLLDAAADTRPLCFLILAVLVIQRSTLFCQMDRHWLEILLPCTEYSRPEQDNTCPIGHKSLAYFWPWLR